MTLPSREKIEEILKNIKLDDCIMVPEDIDIAVQVLTALKDGKLVDSNLVPKLAKEIALKLTALASKVKPVVTEEWLDRVLPKIEKIIELLDKDLRHCRSARTVQECCAVTTPTELKKKALADCREAILKGGTR